jgi:hypothetical protein
MLSGRKRQLSNEDVLQRVQTLSAAARSNAPDPHYLDRGPYSRSGTPLITPAEREKVVTYINEVRARARRTRAA